MGYKPFNISHNINPPPVALLLAIMISAHNGEIFLIYGGESEILALPLIKRERGIKRGIKKRN